MLEIDAYLPRLAEEGHLRAIRAWADSKTPECYLKGAGLSRGRWFAVFHNFYVAHPWPGFETDGFYISVAATLRRCWPYDYASEHSYGAEEGSTNSYAS